MELLHNLVEGQKLTPTDFWVLQWIQLRQHLQADVGNKCTWGQIHLIRARFPTPPKSTTNLGRVVRKTTKKAKNDATYKVRPSHNIEFSVNDWKRSFKSNQVN
jgi:hypothetical protein